MDPNLEPIIASLITSRPSTAAAIQSAEAKLGIVLPRSYMEFLLRTNGAKGAIGEYYVALWPVERLPEENAAAGEFVDGLLLIGSDGAGEAFAFDVREPGRASVIQIPFVGLDADEIVVVGEGFGLWLQQMRG